MTSIKVKDFNLTNTLECGQFFRYKKINDKNNSYIIQSKDKIAIIYQKKDTLHFRGTMTKKFLKDFFRFDDDFEKIKKQLKKDKNVKQALQKYPGLRLIRQDPWECLISYVCSSASNIPKIQKNIELLSQHFGKKKTYTDKIKNTIYTYYTFPTIGEFNNKNIINSCKVGYRDKFIYEINKLLTKNKLNTIIDSDYKTAKELLKQLPGIGDKIADCICLFSLNHLSAFPVDVWVKRTMTELYGQEMKKELEQQRGKGEQSKKLIKQQKETKRQLKETPKKLQEEKIKIKEVNKFNTISDETIRYFAKKHFKEYAGYSQQYLFHLRRNQ